MLKVVVMMMGTAPFQKPPDALCQLAGGFILGVDDRGDLVFWQVVANSLLEVLREIPEGEVAALRRRAKR
jgi:hypothetical protein